jgi:hypothetical protein
MGMGQACREVDRIQREEAVEERDSAAIGTEK